MTTLKCLCVFLLMAVATASDQSDHDISGCFDMKKIHDEAVQGGDGCETLEEIEEPTGKVLSVIPDSYKNREKLTKCFFQRFQINTADGALDAERLQVAIKAVIKDDKRNQVLQAFEDCKTTSSDAEPGSQTLLECFGKRLPTICGSKKDDL